jgi:hypothetical protein
MVLPERHHAAQQTRAPQQGALQHGRPSDHDVAAAAGRNVAAIVGELLRGQPVLARFLKQHGVDPLQLVPCARGRQIHLQNTGVRA